MDKPQYAYAALVEGDAGDRRHSGETAVPLIGKVLREVYKDDKPAHHKKKHSDDDDNNDNDDNGDNGGKAKPADSQDAD